MSRMNKFHLTPLILDQARWEGLDFILRMNKFHLTPLIHSCLPDWPITGTLLLADLAELTVVQQRMYQVHSVTHCSCELGHVLSKSRLCCALVDAANDCPLPTPRSQSHLRRPTARPEVERSRGDERQTTTEWPGRPNVG